MADESAFVEKYNEWMSNLKLNCAKALGKKDDIKENNNIKGDYDFSIFKILTSEEINKINEENSKLNYNFGRKLTNENYDNLVKCFRNNNDFIDNETEELFQSKKSFDVLKK